MEENKEISNSSDLTFITNEPGNTLKERLDLIIENTKFFDCIVAYFYVSGFYLISNALEKTEKIRILSGMGASKETRSLNNAAGDINRVIDFSDTEVKKIYEENIKEELENSDDSPDLENGIKKFINWIKNGKLEVKAYPSKNLHAKVYIMTLKKGRMDCGTVITGSSNLTTSSLKNNLEFNVELKNRGDYEFAKNKFEELWRAAVPLNKIYQDTITEKSPYKDVTPYKLYLKFLYEYFIDDLNITYDIFLTYLPEGFKKLEYQRQAVINAKKIVEAYGGVFLSDVVGIGKTYIAAMLAKQLDGRTMVIAPPSLLESKNPNSWPNVFSDFNVAAKFFSIGKLKDAAKEISEREYKNIIIDESHRFRSEDTISYEYISEICRGKRVILVSATPYNNALKDLLSQIKLFQPIANSTIPGITNLDLFFSKYENNLKKVDRSEDYDEYLKIVKQNSREIRNKLLKYIMVRRTRAEIEKYFSEDLKNNNIRFPEIEDPIPFFYQLNTEEDAIFMKTIEQITKSFKYSRYTPLLYLKNQIKGFEAQQQRNLGVFMKVLLVKRLESSFFAFRNTVERFIKSYDMFLKEYDNGNVYLSKMYINKIFQLIEEGDDEAIQKLIDEGKAERYRKDDFKANYRCELVSDLNILKEIKQMWESIKRDPKIETLIQKLKNHPILKNKKIIIFTESKETAEYLAQKINSEFKKEIALVFHGSSPEDIKDKVIKNFDAKAKDQKEDFQILVSTEVLSEGVNLHRSNIVINYDIPWNPTRLMQRIGRINRVDTKFDKLYTFNFFPTVQADTEIELTNIARAKIEAFLTLLGGDAAILTEGEPVSSHELFDRLLSKKSYLEEGEEEESELKYLRIIENVRENAPDLFEEIKKLPKKARSAKAFSKSLIDFAPSNSLITFFRKDKLMKFYLSSKKETKEVDFITAAKILESNPEDKIERIPIEVYYEYLMKNKEEWLKEITEDTNITIRKGGSDSQTKLLKVIKAIQKNSKQLTEDQEEYLKKVINQLEVGSLPKKTIQKTLNSIHKLNIEEALDPLKIISVLEKNISKDLLKSHLSETSSLKGGKKEIILSLYLKEVENE